MALDACAPWLPPLLAFFACISSGLTAFGDGILFLVMWSVLTTAGAVDGTKPTALTQGVLHVMVLSLAPLPYLCWVARQEIRGFFWWACTMALPSGALVPLGMALLFV
jgi:hypothetical protein